MTDSRTGLAALGVAAAVFIGALFTANPAKAVVFDASALPPCYAQDSPFVPPLKQRTTIKLELHLCEEMNHVSAIFVGDRISPGEYIALSWKGQYWQGFLKMRQSTNAGGNREVEASGWVMHNGAPQFDFTLTGGGTGDPFVETIESTGGSVPHDGESDDYFINFMLDEGRTLLGVNPGGGSHNVTERGWKLQIDGFHGNGPFEFFNQPKPFNIQLANIPLPASALALLAGLVSLVALRRRG